MIKNRIYAKDDVIKYNNAFSKLGYIPIFEPANEFTSRFFHFKGVLRKLSNEDVPVINFFKGKLFKPESLKNVEDKLKGYRYVISHTNILDKSRDLLSVRLLSKRISLSEKSLEDLFKRVEEFNTKKNFNLLKETAESKRQNR